MYMAPERFHHLDQVDQRSDIYSLGCVGYYLATGATPFFDTDAESLFALIMNQQPINLATRRGEQVPREFTNLFIKCMAKNPNDRFQTVKDFVLAIETIQSNFRWTPNDSRAWWLQYGNSQKDDDIDSPTKNQGS
jgi:serine/threonine protein kinase